MAENIRNEAKAAYLKINHQWLKFHHEVLLLCVLISATFEILIYFVIRFTGTMYDSDWSYWIKYIIAPISIGILIAILSFVILRMKRLRIRVKIYSISIMFMMIAAYLSFVHSGYQAILFTFLIPIIMTIMYENQRLTRIIAILTIPLEIFTGLTKLWDPYKDITHGTYINLIIIVLSTIVMWMISYYMIKFSLQKREIIIQKDMERQELKEKILLDELTNVGNKQALLKKLNQLEEHKESFHLAMLDIDDFKRINDENGHLFGDEVLKCLGVALNKMRDTCSVYRYGGDEFSVIMLDVQKQQVLRDVKYLQSDFLDAMYESKRNITIPITISVGVALYHENMSCIELMKKADEALYESKKHRKSTITYCE